MFWTFLNRWSWGLEHKTSHDLTKTSKSVISLLFIPATHSRANLVLFMKTQRFFFFSLNSSLHWIQHFWQNVHVKAALRLKTPCWVCSVSSLHGASAVQQPRKDELSSLDCLYLDEIWAAYWNCWEKLDCGLWKMCWFLQKTEKCNLSSWLTVRAYFGFALLRGHHKITRQQNTQILSWDLMKKCICKACDNTCTDNRHEQWSTENLERKTAIAEEVKKKIFGGETLSGFMLFLSEMLLGWIQICLF